MVAEVPTQSDRPSLVSVTQFLIRARWLAVLLGVLGLLLLLPSVALGGSPLGGLTDTVTEVTDEVVEPVVETVTEPAPEPVVETVTEPVVAVVEPVVTTATDAAGPAVAVVEPVIETVAEPVVEAVGPVVDAIPDVAAGVELTAPLADVNLGLAVGTPGGTLDATIVAGIDLAAPLLGDTTLTADGGLTLDIPGLGAGTSVGVGGSLPAGGGDVCVEITPPAVCLPPALNLPPPIGNIDNALSTNQPIAVCPTSSVLLDAVPCAVAQAPPAPTTDSGTLASISSELGRALERLVTQLSTGLIGQGGVPLAGAAALLILLALVSPLTRGGLLPASAVWKPVRFVEPLDPPG